MKTMPISTNCDSIKRNSFTIELFMIEFLNVDQSKNIVIANEMRRRQWQHQLSASFALNYE